jgi:hypothetical protein
MNTRDVGGMGESVLKTWAHEFGAIVNKAQYDRGGWDFVLEWAPSRQQLNVPLDRRPGLFQCLIQVKATDHHERRRPVSLQNWQRFTTTTLPAFFLILEFDGRSDCQLAFLKHHWSEDIVDTLRRLRKLDAAGRSSPKGTTRALTWGIANHLDVSSAALFQALESHIGSSMADYAARKHQLLSQVGYEDRGAEGSVRIEVPVDYQDRTPNDLMADLRLGVIPSLSTLGATLWDNRFGIKAGKPWQINTRGTIKGPKGKPVALRIHNGLDELKLTATLFAYSPSIEEIDVRKSKARFHIGLVDIVFDYGALTGHIGFRLPRIDEPCSVQDLYQWGRFVTFLIQVAAARPGDELRVECEGIYAGHVKIDQVDITPEWTTLAKLAKTLGDVLRHVDTAKDRRIAIDLLMHQETGLQLLGTLLSGGVPKGRIEFDVGSGPHGPEVPIGDVVVPSVHWVQTLEELYVFPCLHYGSSNLQVSGAADTLAVTISHSRYVIQSFFQSRIGQRRKGGTAFWMNSLEECRRVTNRCAGGMSLIPTSPTTDTSRGNVYRTELAT